MLFQHLGLPRLLPDRLSVFLLVRKNNRWMNVWLLIASYTFYGWWNPCISCCSSAPSAIDYLMVVLMEQNASTRTALAHHQPRQQFRLSSPTSSTSDFITRKYQRPASQPGSSYQLVDFVTYPHHALLSFMGAPERLAIHESRPCPSAFPSTRRSNR